jgi:thioredoxin reductase (NADPH)
MDAPSDIADLLPGPADPPLSVLFCGVNAPRLTVSTGEFFAQPGNRFWRALYGAGFTPRLLASSEYHELARLGYGRWDDFEGAGIYFTATELEARSCGDNPITVIGGANSAGQAATMSAYLIDRLRAHTRVTIRTETEVSALAGEESLHTVTLRHRGSGECIQQPCHGLFCFIGADPTTSWIDGVALADDGFIRTDNDLTAEDLGPQWAALNRRPLPFETSVPRVFAVGDVRYGSMKRIAAAAGEGASAVRSVHASLSKETA